jgi:hypothetical protein
MTMADDVAAPMPKLDELDTDLLFGGAKAGAAGTAAPASSVRRLTVGRADDPSERLADRMADSAVSQLRRSEHGPSPVRRASSNPKDPLGGSQVDDDIQRTIDSRRSSGSGLRKREAEHFSNSYGTDLSGVRIHTDSTADKLSRSLQADAFTTGNDIFFRKGTYQPGTSSGDHLIGHELAHVATESGGARRSIRRFRNMLMSTDDFKTMVPAYTWMKMNYDPPQRAALEKMVAEYYKLVPGTKGQALQAGDLDKAESLLKGMIDVVKSYSDDAGLKKDDKQAKGFKDFLAKVEGVEKAVQDRRLEKGKDPDVKPNEAAQKFKKHDPADNITLFTKVGMILGGQLDEDGKEAEFSVELDIPIAGYKLAAVLKLSGERDEGKYKLKGSIAVKGGGKIPKIAEITASLGGYLEAQAADPKLAGDLLGYALYRRMAESSVVPAEAQYYLFGTAGRDGKESSEANMAYIESMAFGDGADEDNYAESGGFVEVEAEGKGIVSGGAEASMGKRTDKKSLDMKGMKAGEANKGKQSGLVSAVTMGARGAEKVTGRDTKGLNVKLSFSKPTKIEGELQLHWTEEGGVIKKAGDLDAMELGLSITIPEKIMEGFKEKVKPMIDTISAYVEGKVEAAQAKTKAEKGEVFVTKTIPNMLAPAGELISDKVTERAKKAALKTKVPGGKSLKKAIGYKDEEEAAIALSVDFLQPPDKAVSVDFVETETTKLDLLGLKVEMTKTSKASMLPEEEEEAKS